MCQKFFLLTPLFLGRGRSRSRQNGTAPQLWFRHIWVGGGGLGGGEELLYLHKISREKFVFYEKHDDISRRDDS